MATGAAACGSDAPGDGTDVAEAAMPATGAPASMHGWADAAPMKFWASDGASGDDFGYAVAIDGDIAVVGAPGDDDKGRNAGAAYIFERCGHTWVQKAKLYPVLGAGALAGDADLHPPGSPPPSTNFGEAVAIDGKTVVIGAPNEDLPGLGVSNNAGAAYVFKRKGGQWTLQAKLLADDKHRFDGFGQSVAIEDDTVAVGAPGHDHALASNESGAVYVFERSGQTWTQKDELRPDAPTSGEGFGTSVALDDRRLVAGSPGHAIGDALAGAAYVFKHEGGAWTLTDTLLPDAATGEDFGTSVAIEGKRVAVGAPYSDKDAQTTDSGAVYVFQRGWHGYAQRAKLFAEDASQDAHLGISIALEDGTLLAGAPTANGAAPQTGAAYLFGRCHGDWTQKAKLAAADSATFDEFGVSVALDDGTALAGAPGAQINDVRTGAFYAFTRGDHEDDDSRGRDPRE